MKIVSVIPVRGRHSLVKATISRLYLRNKIDHVICAGDEEDRQICETSGAEFFEHSNESLGNKWNAIFQKAKEHKPDVVLLLGSSSWVSDNYLPYMTQFVNDNMLVGKEQFNIVNFGETLEMLRWLHYPKEKHRPWHYLKKMPEGARKYLKAGGRYNEPIGAGRLLRSDFLDAIDWTPYTDANKGLDSIMMKKLSDIGGNYLQVRGQNTQVLKITSNQWGNINSFETYRRMEVKEIITPWEYLLYWFPDITELEL